MISTKRSDSDLPGNLPLLTHVVGDETLDDLPTLTEVIAEPDTEVKIDDFSNLQEFRAVPIPLECDLACEIYSASTTPSEQAVETAEITVALQPDAIPGAMSWPVELPDHNATSELVLPEISSPADATFPVLQSYELETSDLATQPATSLAAAIPRTLTEAELQQLLNQVEAHLATVFMEKLTRHLEQLQRQAVEHAVNELKAELPELLRGALDTHRDTL